MASASLRSARQSLVRLLPLSWFERLIPRDVVGFHYHMVAERPPPHVRHLYQPKTPEQFECDLRFLREHFRMLSYSELVQARTESRAGQRPAAVLTFDDGYAECHSVVRPLLLRYGIPCVFFVTAEFVDNRRLFFRNKASLCADAVAGGGVGPEALRRMGDLAGRPLGSARELTQWLLDKDVDEQRLDRACELLGVDVDAFLRAEQPYMTSEQVRGLADDGFDIGGHTLTHPRMERLGAAEVEREIVASCRFAGELTGAREVPFAFPFSGRGIDRSLLRRVRASHPEVGLLFDTRRLHREQDFIVHRIPAERPPAGGEVRSTLPDDLRGAYLNQIGRGVGDLVRPERFRSDRR